MRPGVSAGNTRSQKSRLQVKTGNYRGLCRRTEPRDPDKHMQAFLDHGTMPTLSFKTSCEKVQASLSRPLQTVRTEHMCIATSILDRVAEEWGCVEELVQTTRGEQIVRSPEEVIDEYLKYHGVPRKIEIRWVHQMNCGGRLQEIGRRVKGQELGFGELHKHLIKYVRSPAKRYWYCVRTKGKLVELDKPGASGKGQVYLEGAVDILRSVDTIDFHLLYSGRVPLSKLARVKNIVRPLLVTLPKFLQDQAKYKNTLKHIGRLNGILNENPSRPLINRRTTAGRKLAHRGLHAAASRATSS